MINLIRQSVFVLFLLFIFICVFPENGFCVTTIKIVDNGNPTAIIIYANNPSAPYIEIIEDGKPKSINVNTNKPSAQIKSAAKLLRDYIKESTSADLALYPDSFVVKSTVKIWVGRSKYVDELKLDLFKLDEDGFVIAFPDDQNIVIVGPTDWGTEFGVYAFLERYVGIRWLFPGPDGEHVPEHSSLDIPMLEVREEPAFFSRQLSGLRGKEQSTWARQNRMHSRVSFHHNLLKLFPPEKYTKTHPEFFPLRDGKRYLPPTNQTHGWQPCFSADGIVEEAVKNINNYFSKNPEKTSYSLGVNDSGGHCECEQCRLRDSGEKNFLGRQDYSDRYFEWANAVVEGVLKKYPNKWFGTLAYSEVAQPPSKVKVNPRIIPYMTYDRMKWIDKEIEEEGEKITEWWARESSSIGWYDYIYGTPYLLPRVYFHKMAEYYQYGYKQGVKAMYAEAYPNWGEGPKLYIALKLQWDPGLDVDKSLNDWYVSAVGEDAASYLAEYYDHWENFWTKRILESKWFTKGGQYLAFHDPGYLDLISFDEISESRALLETVVAKTTTTKQRARAEMLLKAFEYYEASAISYLGLVRNIQESDKDKKYYEDMSLKRRTLVDEFEKDPVLMHPIRFDRDENWKINQF